MSYALKQTWSSWARSAGLTLCLLLPLACQQKMGQQPAYRPLEASEFFPEDQRSARPLVAGTVAQGHLRDGRPQLAGKDDSPNGVALVLSLLGFSPYDPLARR